MAGHGTSDRPVLVAAPPGKSAAPEQVAHHLAGARADDEVLVDEPHQHRDLGGRQAVSVLVAHPVRTAEELELDRVLVRELVPRLLIGVHVCEAELADKAIRDIAGMHPVRVARLILDALDLLDAGE